MAELIKDLYLTDGETIVRPNIIDDNIPATSLSANGGGTASSELSDITIRGVTYSVPTLAGSHTYSGNNTFNGSNTFSGSNTYSGDVDFDGNVYFVNVAQFDGGLDSLDKIRTTSLGKYGLTNTIEIPSTSGTMALISDITDSPTINTATITGSTLSGTTTIVEDGEIIDASTSSLALNDISSTPITLVYANTRIVNKYLQLTLVGTIEPTETAVLSYTPVGTLIVPVKYVNSLLPLYGSFVAVNIDTMSCYGGSNTPAELINELSIASQTTENINISFGFSTADTLTVGGTYLFRQVITFDLDDNQVS